MTNINSCDYQPGDTIYTEDGSPHIIEDVIGNMIYTTDGLVTIIPLTDEE